MPINFPLIETEFQRRANAVDSATNINDILKLLDNINNLPTGKTVAFDSDSFLPTGDSDYEGMIVLSNGAFKVYNAVYNNWDTLDSSSNFVLYFQGQDRFYAAGGRLTHSGSPYMDTIEKASMTSDTGGTDVGNLTTARDGLQGNSSSSHGFTHGGDPSTVISTTIEKFAFASDGDAVDTGGDLTSTNIRVDTSTAVENATGYINGLWAPGNPLSLSTISKFPFAISSGTAAGVGDLTTNKYDNTGQTSTTHGYSSGGYDPTVPGSTNVIEKYPFSSDTNATDVGDLIIASRGGAGQSSTTHGYSTVSFPSNLDIQKFPFSSDTNATDVGDVIHTPSIGKHSAVSGYSSLTHGYLSGGPNGPTAGTEIYKFPFASDGNANTNADLLESRSYMASNTQV